MADNRTTNERSFGNCIPIQYHHNMLLDQVRVSAFRKAIEFLTPPGGKVLELGGGTGVLSYFASQKASRVWCVEWNRELAMAAREFLQQNNTRCHVEVIESDARDYLPPERVDVVICEMLHVASVCEKQLEIMASFKRRYLDCFGPPLPVFVPEASLLAMQLVEQSFDFSGYNAPVPMFQSPDAEHRSCRPLCQPLVYATLEYDRTLPSHFKVRADFLVERAGRLNAVRFITKNVLAIQEAEGSAIEWSNQYLIVPLEETLQVKAGETVTISVDYPAGCQLQELLKSIRARRNNHRGSSKVFYSRCRAA